MAIATSGYTVAPFQLPADRESIEALWRRNFGGGTPARLHWLYEAGPTEGYLLCSSTGDGVGAIGRLQRSCRIDGVGLAAGQALDLNVDVEHRTIGPAMKLQRTAVAPVDAGRMQLIYSFPNEQAEPVLKRIGYRSLGRLQRWVKPLSARGRLRQKLRAAWVAEAVAWPIDLGLRLASRERRRTMPPGFTVECDDRFDARFDDLQQRTRATRPILCDRSSAYLNWRFAAAPEYGYRAMTLSDGDRRLAAYLVFHRRGATASISDFLYDDVAGWHVLLGEFIRRMRSERAEEIAIGFLGPSEPIDVLRQLGFWSRPPSWNVMVYAADAARAEAAGWFDAGRWWLTRADVDTDE